MHHISTTEEYRNYEKKDILKNGVRYADIYLWHNVFMTHIKITKKKHTAMNDFILVSKFDFNWPYNVCSYISQT